MPATTQATSRTERLLALMAKGDELFNARDWKALEPLHHPDRSRTSPAAQNRSTAGRHMARR